MEPDASNADQSAIPASVGAAAALAVDGLLALGALGEDVDDEWQYVQDLVEAWQDRLEEVGSARGDESLDPARGAAVARVVDEARLIDDPHRAIDWLSTLPQVALDRARRAAVRFQDASPDARAVVYAGIQADPLVARAAELLATRHASISGVLARAAMNGESTDADAWRAMFPTLFGADVEPGDRATSEAILEASLAVADRGEQVRSQFRGAIVESLTERLLRAGPARAPRRRRSGASGGSSSTASAPRSTRTTSPSRSRAPPRRSTASGAPGASRPTSSTSSTTRGSMPPTTTSGWRSCSSCSMPPGRATSGWSGRRRRTRRRGSSALEDLDALARRRPGRRDR